MQAEILTSPGFDLDMAGHVPPAVIHCSPDAPDTPIRKNRQLPDRILVAVHQTCDVGDLGIAAQLLSVLDIVVEKRSKGRVDPARQRLMKAIVSAHERLWHLRHSREAVGHTFGGGSDLAW
jgi:hypothetical protein